MSFATVCPNCGSPSGPSVGICPFCKTILSHAGVSATQGETVSKVYGSGNLQLALTLGKRVYEHEPAARKNVDFLVLYAKILLESEAPTTVIQGILGEAYLLSPDNKNVLDYMEILKLRYGLRVGVNDPSEQGLKNLLRRSPDNVHALFILGTHMFWVDQQALHAIPYLEHCVRLAPNFLRAWGCLGAIYKKIGNGPLAKKSFQKCLDLEQEPAMKEFFQKELSGI